MKAAGTRRGSADEVYALLRKRITLGTYGPNYRLKEVSLSEELGISRTPIRAAFQRLEQDGFIEAVPNRGVIVAPWTDLDNDEVFDLRIQLESHGASLAAQRRSESDIARLHALNAEMASLIQQRSEDFRSDIQDINRRFHEAVVQAARSPRLVQMVASLLNTRRVTGAFFFYSDDQFTESLEDHQAITRAIERQQIELAKTLMASHVRVTWERLKSQRQDAGPAAAA